MITENYFFNWIRYLNKIYINIKYSYICDHLDVECGQDQINLIAYLLKYFFMYNSYKTVYLKSEIPPKLHKRLKHSTLNSNLIVSRDNKKFYAIVINGLRGSFRGTIFVKYTKVCTLDSITCNCRMVHTYYNDICIDLDLRNMNHKFVEFIIGIYNKRSLINLCINHINSHKQMYEKYIPTLNKDIRKLF